MRSRKSSPWPWLVAGIAVVGGGTAAAVLLSRRHPMLAPADLGGGSQLLGPTPDAASPEVWPQAMPGGKPVNPDDATDDETALARMLSSEVSQKGKSPAQIREERIVVGWITVQRARRHKKLSLYQFVTNGKGYGGSVGRHASTAEKPTAATRELARQLLAGTVQPSAAIRKHQPGSWFERDQGEPDDRLIAMQAAWNEGIYARVAGSKWMLYSRDTPPIALAPGLTARARLDAVPTVPALDPLVA